MRLYEIFNTQVSWSWKKSLHRVTAVAHLDDKEIILYFSKLDQQGAWSVEFTVDEELKLTGSGSSHAILGAVANAVKDWIIDYNPSWIVWGADRKEPSRVSLYRKLPRALGPSWHNLSQRSSTWPEEIVAHVQAFPELEFTVLSRNIPDASY